MKTRMGGRIRPLTKESAMKENGHPLDLPKEFLIDEDQILAMAS